MSIQLSDVDYCVVDTETTGGQATLNRVIDVAVFHMRDGAVQGKYQTLINPGRPIPAWITGLTGIDDYMVRNAPRFEEIADDLRKFLERGIFVAHNVGFDYKFIQCEYQRLKQVWERPSLCTVRIARKLFPELGSRSLGFLCEHLMIDIADRHRAHGDAEATVYVLKDMIARLRKEKEVHTLEHLRHFLKPERRKKKKKEETPAEPRVFTTRVW